MIVASIRVAINVGSAKEYVSNWFVTVISILFTGITSGTAAMLGIAFVQYIKKNLNYDSQSSWGFSCVHF